MIKRRNRRSWTRDQKRAVVAEARRRIKGGEKFIAVAAALDVHENSLRTWMRRHPERALQPIRLVSVTPEPRGIVLVTPEGLRFEGLDVVSAAGLAE